MNESRASILKAIAANQPGYLPLPDVSGFVGSYPDNEEKFTAILTVIGGQVFKVNRLDEVNTFITERYGDARVISRVNGLDIDGHDLPADAHDLADIELAVLNAQFAVAENGAVWLTEMQMGNRVLPFICQHLAVIIKASDIVATMHEAYQRIAGASYGFGAFIAGPSKTADIEQSLVLGAHGARSMTVFIMGE